ncbi:SDR family oxidoreductase [Altererythrobacter sp. Z27]|uniref:SDR family oxidoreductase n=1 Tax=Altererythrobacter sp. Z27 TaxID=3461147 RepID=UPI004043B44D
MADYVAGKSIVITGAGGGFGRLLSLKAAARGAKITCADINPETAEETAKMVRDAGGEARASTVDVTQYEQVRALVEDAVDAFGCVDVMVNNAGTMPLAMMEDHSQALEAWNRCIDINFKGVMNGCVAAYDPMMKQGRGHVINVSSIYGNHPVVGSAVYGATKAAVNYFSDSFRQDCRGKIKVTIVKPTGVPGTGLGAGVISPMGAIGIVGQNAQEFYDLLGGMAEGRLPNSGLDPEGIDYLVLAPEYIADAMMHAIDQPWGVSIGEITVRAAGDHYIM